MRRVKNNKTLKRISIILLTLSVFIIFITNWLVGTFGNINLDAIIFTINVPLKGTTPESIFVFIKDVLVKSLITLIAIIIIFYKNYNSKIVLNIKKKKQKVQRTIFPIKEKYIIRISIVLLCISLLYINYKLEIVNYIWNQINKSTFIEEKYIETKEENIKFPDKKRNLIYIYLESMETSYSSKKYGGFEKNDLIPELRKLADENISFSNTKKFGGALEVPGTAWTSSAMVAQTSGLPIKLSINRDTYGKYESFFPGAYTLGDILKDNGYNQEVMFGSDSEFSGKKAYFKTHGDYKVYDLNTAIEDGKMTEEDKVWWGYEDSNLFKWAKEEILNLSNKDKPFNFTMLTVDTHFEDGWLSDICEIKYDDQYSNVISCSSKQVFEFINWIKKQDFYDNTTVIISGDHLTMDTNYNKKLDPDYERSIYNVFINSAITTKNVDNRSFSTLDMFPTTIAALGGKIKGERLALGTNLFSNKKTLLEEYGTDRVRDELSRKSTFYDKKILYGKDK